MKVAIDAGHGMGNRTPGVFDPGAVGNGHQEATITLAWAHTLADACRQAGHDVYLTREDQRTETPLDARVGRAVAADCDVFVSIHCNAAVTEASNGTETLHAIRYQRFAAAVHRAAVAELGLRDRGVKLRDELAVLKFPGPACLIELGFISNSRDCDAMAYPPTIRATCDAIARAL